MGRKRIHPIKPSSTRKRVPIRRNLYIGPDGKKYPQKQSERLLRYFRPRQVAPGSSCVWAILDGFTGEFTGSVTYWDLKQHTWMIQNEDEEPKPIDFNPDAVFNLVRTTPKMTLRLICKKLRLKMEELAEILGVSHVCVCQWNKSNRIPRDKLEYITEMLRRRLQLEGGYSKKKEKNV